jgi:catechol 2,3-dioxygenase-like lactoylglutathione lyase family enzyme
MRFISLTIPASSIDQAAAFYGGTLGLETTRTADGLEAYIGSTTLVVNPGAPVMGGIHLAITIPRNQFAEGKAWLAARTRLSVVDGEDEFPLADHPWRSKSVYFTGPDDIVLELITRDALANDSAEPFSSASLLCISEIGMAVQDVPATVAAVHAKYGAEPFGQGGDEFAPVGDNDGLFIVVAVGREWFSAPGSRATGAPTDIRVESTTGQRRGFAVLLA